MKTFGSYHFYENNPDVGVFATTSLGNMGFSKTDCQSRTLIKGSSQVLRCTTGSISSLVDWGILADFEDPFQCARDPTNFCSDYLREDLLHQIFTKHCLGQSTCRIQDLQQMVKKTPKAAQCAQPSARFFI